MPTLGAAMSRRLRHAHARKTPAPALAAAVTRLSQQQSQTELLQHTLLGAELRRVLLLDAEPDGTFRVSQVAGQRHDELPLASLPWLAEQLKSGATHHWLTAHLPAAAQAERAYWAAQSVSAAACFPISASRRLLAEANSALWQPAQLAALKLAAVALAADQHNERLQLALRSTRSELTSLREQLCALDPRDPLTGVLCRQSLEANLNEEVARAVREGSHLSLVLSDIDQFEQYHAEVGTDAGNYCLQQVASTLAGAFERAGERVGRWDKDCFAVMMPGLDPQKAERAARRLSATLSARQLGNGWGLNFRLGVATVRPSAAMGAEQLVELARLALQEARQQDQRMVCKHWV